MSIEIDESLTVAQGANRTCYRHPEDFNKCIKIPKINGLTAQLLECEYLQKQVSKNISWKHMSRYYGEIETNLGKGYVYELIRDYNKAISLPFSYYFEKISRMDIPLKNLLRSLGELKEYLLENEIIVKSVKPYNILFKRINQKDGIAVIVDNIGHHNNRIHISDHISFLARKDIKNKWEKFEQELSYKILN